MRRAAARIALLTGLVFGAGPALALSAALHPGGSGFDDTNLGGLPSWSFDFSDGFLAVGEAGTGGFDVDVTGSTDVCILFGDETCRATTQGITGPYSVLVTLSVSAVAEALFNPGPFSLFLSGVMSVPGSEYDTSEVVVELNPTLPTSLDTTAVPGFVWNGGFTAFSHLVYDEFDPFLYDYIGWAVNIGDSVTFRYDVLTSPDGRGTPALLGNATTVIPEPGAALLMGIGLAGLAATGRRTEAAD